MPGDFRGSRAGGHACMTHYDLPVPQQSLQLTVCFPGQSGCEIGLSEPVTVAAAAPPYKQRIIPGEDKNEGKGSYDTHS